MTSRDAAHAYIQWKGWDPARFGRCRPFEGAYYGRELAQIPLKDSARVLEIGFGNGTFLAFARARGLRIDGVEANAVLISTAIENGYPAFDSGSLEDPSLRGQYDLIVAFDVIEHLGPEELPRYLETISALLAPSGHFVARFPNGGSPFARINQHGDISHRSVLARPAVEQLAALAGLEVVCVRNQRARLHDNLGIAIARSLQRGVRLIVEILLGLLYYERVEPLELNLVAILRKPSL